MKHRHSGQGKPAGITPCAADAAEPCKALKGKGSHVGFHGMAATLALAQLW